MIPDILRRDGPPTRVEQLLISAMDCQLPRISDGDAVKFHELLDRYCYQAITLETEHNGIFGPRVSRTQSREIIRPFAYVREQYMVNPMPHYYRYKCSGFIGHLSIRMEDIPGKFTWDGQLLQEDLALAPS